MERFSEYIGYDDNGRLRVEEADVAELAPEFGTPLYVTSNAQIRHNYRRFHQAFADHYPSVHVHYAIKANNNLAVRHILTQEGAGGECFGAGELWATLAGGTDPAHVVLNGSNKSIDEIRMAIEAGVTINIDATDELDLILPLARELGKRVAAGFRVKPYIPSLSTWKGLTPDSTLADLPLDVKWGLDEDTVCAMIERCQAVPDLIALQGFSFHIGRKTNEPAMFASVASGVVDFIARVRERTGFIPQTIDLGGGYAHGRDPEGGKGGVTAAPVAEFGRAIGQALIEALDRHDLGRPTLILEPGRHLVGNSTILLAQVGAIKDLPGHAPWVHVDTTGNHIMRLLTAGYYYHCVPVIDDGSPRREVEIVGPSCMPDVLEKQVLMPKLKRGDLVAFVDAGMYAETNGNQYNGIPRPATVLVTGDRVDLIKERETFHDIFVKQRVPEWLTQAQPVLTGSER